MKKTNTHLPMVCIVASVVLLTQSASVCASQKPLQRFAQQENALSTSSASNASAPAISSRAIIPPSSCPTYELDSQESPNSDTQDIRKTYPTKNQQNFVKQLYIILNQFPIELIKLVATYLNFDLHLDMQCVQELTGHKELINTLLPITDTQFASASNDHTIKLWVLKDTTWSCTATLTTHEDDVTALALLDKNWLISGSSNGTIILWYLIDNKPKYLLDTIHGKINNLVALSDESFASASNRAGAATPAIIIWEKAYQQHKATWHVKQTFPTQNHPLFLIKFIHEKGCYVACGFNEEIQLYRNDGQNWNHTNNFQPDIASPLLQAMMIYNPNPTTHSLLCAYKKMIVILDPTLQPIQTLLPPLESSSGGKYSISACAPWKDAQIALGISCQLISWILFQDAEQSPQEDRKALPKEWAHAEPITNLISLGNQQLASAGSCESTIKIWEQPYVIQDQSTTCVML